jgi:hypothetical protein
MLRKYLPAVFLGSRLTPVRAHSCSGMRRRSVNSDSDSLVPRGVSVTSPTGLLGLFQPTSRSNPFSYLTNPYCGFGWRGGIVRALTGAESRLLTNATSIIRLENLSNPQSNLSPQKKNVRFHPGWEAGWKRSESS